MGEKERPNGTITIVNNRSKYPMTMELLLLLAVIIVSFYIVFRSVELNWKGKMSTRMYVIIIAFLCGGIHAAGYVGSPVFKTAMNAALLPVILFFAFIFPFRLILGLKYFKRRNAKNTLVNYSFNGDTMRLHILPLILAEAGFWSEGSAFTLRFKGSFPVQSIKSAEIRRRRFWSKDVTLVLYEAVPFKAEAFGREYLVRKERIVVTGSRITSSEGEIDKIEHDLKECLGKRFTISGKSS